MCKSKNFVLYFWQVNLHASAYRDGSFVDRFFKHDSIKSRVRQIKERGLFKVRQIGQSVLGKEIFCISAGHGKVNILIWSQMHGDEPTGTMAIFDLLNFLGSNDLEHVRNTILSQCTVHFIPMLNPDGADFFQRRNALNIDINRDFLAMQTPEAKVLLNAQEEIQPAFAFNLHDQNTLWSVTGSRKSAAISLLAPPVDCNATVTPSRLKAMQLAASVYNLLHTKIPGQVGRWSEEYEPRAVGEVFQSRGISTVLVEAGGFVDDDEKQLVRQLNFELLLHSLEQIATGVYSNEKENTYHRIPLNNKEIFHLLIRNCKVASPAGYIKADIGLNYTEELDAAGKNRTKMFSVADFGDLSTWGAYESIDVRNAVLKGTLKIDAVASFNIEDDKGIVLSFVKGIKRIQAI
ncbi:M14 family zinc carboxypeptidase [Arcticibacter tournemirensis]|nr:M14 family zinc carboxypeptidase [Arcticibacter tournemirensis]